GVAGEREVAQAKLQELLKKHNLTLEDIADETTNWVGFSYRTKYEERLLLQCAFYITNAKRLEVKEHKKARKIYFNLTRTQAADLESIYDHYRKEFKKELETLFLAFLHRHHIFPSSDGDNDNDEDKTPLSQEKIKQIIEMIKSMNSKDWDKRRRIGR
ncbi:MAG: hypothetical protein D6726_12515, partial [Nitrospirae bacterium]